MRRGALGDAVGLGLARGLILVSVCWAPTDPTGWIAIGNPPSGIAAAYCIVDWVALHAAGYAGRATIGLRGAPKTAA